MTVRLKHGDEFFHHLETKFRVLHLATPETQRHFHLHVFAEEIYGVADFDRKIMRINARAELDFFYRGSVLMLLGFLFLLGQFVSVFAEVHHPANGRHSVGCDLDQINRRLTREVDRVVKQHDAELAAIEPDHTDFAGADFPVDLDERCGRRITWRKRAAQGTLVG